MSDINSLVFVSKRCRKEAVGSDIREPLALRGLPDVFQILANAIRSSTRAVATPHPHMLSLNPLLGMRSNTCRTVCATFVIHKTTLRANRTVRQSATEIKQSYGMATLGSSPVVAALRRTLRAELSLWSGDHFVPTLDNFGEIC